MTGTVYFANGTVYYIDNAGCAKFNSLDTAGATSLGSTLGVTGATTLSSTLAVTGATTLSGTLAVTDTATMYHVIPADNNTTYELGSATARWKKLHIGTADTYGGATQPIWWSDGKPAECTSYANAAVKSAGEFTSAQSVTLTGDVTGTTSSKAGWSIAATAWKLTPHDHDATYVAAATVPTDYNGKLIFTGMKTNTTLGITSELTYSYVIGLRGYSSKSGGGSHEFAFNDSAIYHRMSSTGADTWGSWNMLVRSAAGSAAGSATQPVWVNSAGIITACTSYANASVNYANSAGAVAWGNVTDKPSTFTPSTHLQAIANGGTSATTAQDATWNLLHVANPGDLNTAKRMGNFKISNTTTNVPVSSGMWGATWNIVDDAAAGNNGTSGSTWQLVFQSNSNNMWLRCITNAGNWTDYAKFLSDKNYTDYTVTKTGTGASGTWGISISGNATTASGLKDGSNTMTSAYNKSGLAYADYTWLAGWNGYELRAVNKSQFAQASHSHSTLDSLVTISRANHSNDTGIIVNNTDSTNTLKVGYIIGSSGNAGIYDFTHSAWKVQIAPNGTTTFNGNATSATTATKATQDGSGNTITSYYVTLSTDQTNITGCKRFTKAVQCYRYTTNNNLPAITMDKPGSNYVGIGADGTSNRIKFGPFNNLAGDAWVAQSSFNSNQWFFQGSIYGTSSLTLEGSITMGAGCRIESSSGVTYLGHSNNSSWVYVQDVCSHSGNDKWKIAIGGTANFTKCYGAVWNDYAEMRRVPEAQNNIIIKKDKKDNIIERTYPYAGYCVSEVGDGSMHITTQRLQKGCKIISDTFGFCIGETEDCKTPIAVTGRVLAYPYEDIEKFKSHIGDFVCSGPNGTISIMSSKEAIEHPESIIGTISEIPNYTIWHCGNEDTKPIQVDGRIWIYVR